MPIFYALLLAHLITDFMQPAILVRLTKRGFAGVLVHTIVYLILCTVVLFGYGSYWWVWVIVLAFSHFFVDHLKYVLNYKVSRGFYVFILDQIIHVAIIALVVFKGNFAKLEPSPFLYLVSDYWKLLPAVAGYVAGTFGASILVFEAGRTFTFKSDCSVREAGQNAVATFRERFPGIVERALAISFIVASLYYLLPFAFSISIYKIIKRYGTTAAKRFIIEFVVSTISAITIGLAILLF